MPHIYFCVSKNVALNFSQIISEKLDVNVKLESMVKG